MRNYIALLFLTIVLAGCSDKQEEALLVELQASTEQVQAWEPIRFDIHVETFGELEEAAIVEMELKNAEQQTVGILPATLVAPGEYMLETVLDVAGEYEVISHVTVDEHHSMPSITITVVE